MLQAAVADGQSARPNTWSARSSTGLTLSGTWTLVDATGKTVTRGGWSAAKSPTGWTGAWRAAVSGSKAEYSGTWSASVNVKGDAHFADLFKMAVQTAVSGNWRAGGHSGVWSIRAFQ